MTMSRKNFKRQTREKESTDASYRGGRSRSSDEVAVMETELRGPVIRFDTTRQLTEPSIRRNLMNQTKPKPFSIERKLVMEAYQKVKSNQGSAGIDGLTLKEFENNYKDHLYKLWNRMSSGSYMPPPVQMVEIPKKGGGKRPLGIPTVSDRIAQTVVKMVLEPVLEPIFQEDSYGYRPGKSAIEALTMTRKRCWSHAWVIDLDIRNFFDSIPHELLLKAIKKHTDSKWIVLYITRWLKAPVQDREGNLKHRDKGTPQGCVISPLLANLFLHYCMDEWLKRNFPQYLFERYADDAVIHCITLSEAKEIKEGIRRRFAECGLELHPEKTKIVYCRSSNRTETYPVVQFDFLGYTFRPRKSMNKQGVVFTGFLPAVSTQSETMMKAKMRSWNMFAITNCEVEDIALEINKVVRGWMNYYGHFYKTELKYVFAHIDRRLAIWAHRKFKRLRGRKVRAIRWVEVLAKREPTLFAHWQLTRPRFG